jgi:hypothetical protein
VRFARNEFLGQNGSFGSFDVIRQSNHSSHHQYLVQKELVLLVSCQLHLVVVQDWSKSTSATRRLGAILRQAKLLQGRGGLMGSESHKGFCNLASYTTSYVASRYEVQVATVVLLAS